MARPPRQPTLRHRSNGDYFARWGGKDHYFSRDPKIAEQMFLDPDSAHAGSLANWHRWKLGRIARPARATITVAHLCHSFFDSLSPIMLACYRTRLTRFVNLHGSADALTLAIARPEAGIYAAPVVPLLGALRDDMLASGFAPRTICHDLGAVQRLFNWSHQQGLLPAVVWIGLKKPAVPDSLPEPISPARVADLVASVTAADTQIGLRCGLQYLTACRVSEVETLIRASREIAARGASELGRFAAVRQGERTVCDRGLMELLRHKTRGHGQRRFVILTDAALIHLDSLSPLGTDLRAGRVGYTRRASELGVVSGPHIFRDSAASHLLANGLAEADVARVLGHARSDALRFYGQVAWHALRRKVAELEV